MSRGIFEGFEKGSKNIILPEAMAREELKKVHDHPTKEIAEYKVVQIDDKIIVQILHTDSTTMSIAMNEKEAFNFAKSINGVVKRVRALAKLKNKSK